jgi:hypothetical protein
MAHAEGALACPLKALLRSRPSHRPGGCPRGSSRNRLGRMWLTGKEIGRPRIADYQPPRLEQGIVETEGRTTIVAEYSVGRRRDGLAMIVARVGLASQVEGLGRLLAGRSCQTL